MSNTKPIPNGQVHYILNGSTLRRKLHGRSARARAQFAAKLIENGVTFSDLSAAQISRLCGANTGTVTRELGHAGSRGAQQRTVDRIARKYTADTLMRALDRLTAGPRPELRRRLRTR